MKKSAPELQTALVLLIAFAIFGWLCYHFRFVQDDAYISFRYARNFIDGHGLVFNPGERVEGYTNFLWIIGLIALKKLLNIDFLVSSRIMGVFSGTLIFVAIRYLALKYENKKASIITGLTSVMLLSCTALPYWSVSGLETTAFSLLVLAALILEVYKSRYTPIVLAMATMLRPEGGIAFGVILLSRLIWERKRLLNLLAMYFLLLVPLAIFKLSYYGSLLPNTFYAKSGASFDYFASGLEYADHFFRTIGVYGLIFIPIIIASKKLWGRYKLFYLFIIIYTFYIILIGGDVLKVYRFFIPIVPVLFYLFVVSTWELIGNLVIKSNALSKFRVLLLSLIVIAFAAGSWTLSRNHVDSFLANERIFINKMKFMGRMLNKHMGQSYTLATSTIGLISYKLPDYRVIDMLGLTDSYIAGHPENVPGIESSWKERHYNAQYVLEQQPDFILFSTNQKPSAPAERALFLHSEFRKKYLVIGFHRDMEKKWVYIYHRRGTIEPGKDSVTNNPEFPDFIHRGFTALSNNEYQYALASFQSAMAMIPDEENVFLLNSIGECYYRMERNELANEYFNRALTADPDDCISRWRLGQLANRHGDTAAVNRYAGDIRRLQPWLLDFSEK